MKYLNLNGLTTFWESAYQKIDDLITTKISECGGVDPEIIEKLRTDITALQAKDVEHDTQITQIVDIVTALFELLSDTDALFAGVYEEIDKLEKKHDADITTLSKYNDKQDYNINFLMEQDEQNTNIHSMLNQRISALESEIEISIAVYVNDKSVSVIQAGTPITVVIKADVTQNEAYSMYVDQLWVKKDGGETLKLLKNGYKTLSIEHTLTLKDTEEVEFEAFALTGTLPTWEARVTITARNLIVFGMGASAEDIAAKKPGTKLAKSAAGQSYTGKVATDVVGTQKMYILVPDNVTLPTSFKVNTFAAEYKKGEKITVDGITYTPYASGGNYAAGKSITVVT